MQTQDHQPTDGRPAARQRGNPLAVRRFPVALLAGCLAALVLGSGRAAEPRRPPAEVPFADPQKMFDQMFGPETEADEKALAQVEVSMQEERQMGETAVAAFLAGMKQRRINVVSRAKDVQYLRDLVETIRPLMTNGKRYPKIHIYLVQSSDCEARTFPGGTIVFFRGLLEVGGSEAAVVGIVGHELAHLDRRPRVEAGPPLEARPAGIFRQRLLAAAVHGGRDPVRAALGPAVSPRGRGGGRRRRGPLGIPGRL